MTGNSGNITELKMAGVQYNFLFNKAAIPAALSKLPENVFVEINEAFQKIFGYSQEEVFGKSSVELGMVRAEEREKTMREVQQHGFSVDVEKQVYTKSGELRHVLINVNSFEWNNEQYAITTLQDITDRKCAEDALDKIMERLDLAARSANIGIYDWDIVNNKLVWDDQMYRLYGISKSSFREAYEAWLNGVHPEDRAYSDDISKQAIAGKIEYNTEFRVLWPDGSIHWLKAHGQIFRDNKGNPRRMVGVNYDITKDKESQRKIFQLKRLYATLSQINQTIVRVKEKSELYQSICDVSVTFGEFKLACIYDLEDDSSIIRLVSCSGNTLEEIPYPVINIEDPVFNKGLISQAVLGTKTVTSDDILNDPRMEHWIEYSKIAGYRAQASVPFRLKGKTIGVLNLYSAETNYFKADAEILLLDEIGLDISFALNSLEKEKEQKRSHDELRQTQDKLLSSERTLKIFVEYAPAAIAMFDREMKYLAVSERFITDYRLNNRDIIGHSHYDIFPEIGENWKAIHRNCLAGAIEKADRDPFLRADGKLDWIQWEIHPWYEKSGKIGGILLFSEVITDRIKAEEELVKSENRYRTTLETMLEGCQIMDFDWRYLFINLTAEIHNHIPREKMLGRTYTEVWPGIEKTNVYAVIKRCLEDRTASHMENEFTYPDGSVGWFELSIQPVPEGVFILSIDITERKRAEEKLTEALEHSSNIIRSSPHAIIVTDSSGIVTVWNEAAEEMFGWTEKELTGRPIPIVPEDKTEEVKYVRQRLMEGKSIFNFETIRRHKNGSLVQVSFSASPFRNGKCEITGILAEVQDISKRKQAEDEIKKLNEELELRVIERTRQFEEANKELEAFSYSVSHDLRAPLRAMSGFAKILQEGYSSTLDDEGNRLLQIITGNAKKMGTLIDDLLAFSRLGKQEMHFTMVNMHDLAESVFHELVPVKEKDTVNFILHDIPPAFGDESMIKQVWVNLIGNAIKFSSLKETRIIEIDCRESGAENIYSVKDNGAGFDMKYANKLFGVFQRLHSVNQFEGTGVGLAIVQRIILRLRGRIWAEGVENEGAVFYFTLASELKL